MCIASKIHNLHAWIRNVWPEAHIVIWIHDNTIDIPFTENTACLTILAHDPHLELVRVSEVHMIHMTNVEDGNVPGSVTYTMLCTLP
jgi:hypothetical protein